ncbi:PAS domain S-box protein [Candidatus Magnetomonas plexicatena]|uniref:PAS domain S-box protein n=1 Tax=Candidatus Magnetomonas plexicatena TaxID=2552947 RepID=UPI001C757B57|nr:PAS domain S-box protein [Nitrospirales bacterium LBB_01]
MPNDKIIKELTESLAKANEELQQERLDRQRAEAETEALLKGTRAVLEYKNFAESARKIFDVCKDIVGATAGYVALLTPDGNENEVLFLEAGGMPCTVDPSLPMPIRGLREVAYRTRKAVYDNNFASSAWMDFMPEGHVYLGNVMFSPLILDNKAVGLIGLANKPGAFIDRDANLALAFGEYAAIALLNSRSRESLEINQNKLQSVVDTANDAIITINSNQKIIYWNKAAENIFGYSTNEALNSDITIIIPETLRQRHRQGVERVNQTGKSSLTGKTIEMLGLRKNGEEFPVELSIAAWKVKDEGFYTGIIRDITHRKEYEEKLRSANEEMESLVQKRTNELSKALVALKESEERYRGIFNDTQTAILILNPDTLEVVEVNDKACSFYGYTKEEFSKKKLVEINTLSEQQLISIALEVKSKKQANLVTCHRTCSGEIRDVEVHTGPIKIKGETFICSMIYDITERKRMEDEIKEINLNLQKKIEKEVAKNRIKDQMMFEQSRHVSMGELLMNISHHWRQPLCAIGVSIQDLRDAYQHGELSEPYITKNVGNAMKELLALSETIDNFRSFYVKENKPKQFNVAGEINKAEGLIAGYLQDKGIVVEKELEENLKIWGYQNEFAHVILNILTNARDIFEERNITGGKIKVKLSKDVTTDKIVITISDNGGEIPKNIIKKIFDPYFTTKDKVQGAGMGLYMAKVIIEKNMKGTISVRNDNGWCEFRIEL